MVGNGTMVCVDGGGSIALGKKDRTNNKYRLVILAPYKPRNHEI